MACIATPSLALLAPLPRPRVASAAAARPATATGSSFRRSAEPLGRVTMWSGAANIYQRRRPSATARAYLGRGGAPVMASAGGHGTAHTALIGDSGDGGSKLVTERHRIPTPEGATPEGVCNTVAELAKHFDWTGPIGVGFPAAIKPDGTVLTAANISKTWIGVNAQRAIKEATGAEVVRVVNDADAAGEAEMLFGAGKGVSGTVFLFTFGTGVGSALFLDGKLVPNTELGHMLINTPKGAAEGEHYAADKVRETEGLKLKNWAARVATYLKAMQDLFYPDLIIVGGGVSKKSDKWLPIVAEELDTPIVPAKLRNEAGIVGAAAAVASLMPNKDPMAV